MPCSITQHQPGVISGMSRVDGVASKRVYGRLAEKPLCRTPQHTV